MEHWVDYESAGQEDNDEDDRKPPARRTVTDRVRNTKQKKHTAPFSHDNDDDDDDDDVGGNEYHEAYNAFSSEKDDKNGRHNRILGIRIRGPRTNQKTEMLFRPSPAERPRWKLEEDMIASLLVEQAELVVAYQKYMRNAVCKYLDTNTRTSSVTTSNNKSKIPGVLVDNDHWEVAGIHDFREGKQKGEETQWLLSWVGYPHRTWEPDSNLSSSCKAEAEKFRRKKKPEAKTKGSDTDDSDWIMDDHEDEDTDYDEPTRPAKKTGTGSPRPPPAAPQMLSAAHVQGEAKVSNEVRFRGEAIVSRPAKKTMTNEVGFRVGDKVRLDWDRHFSYKCRMKYWKRTKAEGKIVVLSRVTPKTVCYRDKHGQEHRKSNHNVSKLSSFTFTEGEGHGDGNGGNATEMRAKSPTPRGFK